jgi:hypothetical protein
MESCLVHLSEALEIMGRKDRNGKPVPFDISYRTFNSQTKKGGKLKFYKGAVLVPGKNPDRIPDITLGYVAEEAKTSRNPEHYKNRTRNIELENGEIRKILIDFIDTVNGKKMIY